jgi:hypothetical protein
MPGNPSPWENFAKMDARIKSGHDKRMLAALYAQNADNNARKLK